MKIFFSITILLAVLPLLSFGQNKVTIAQNGRGNSISIHQSKDKSTDAQSAADNCKDTVSNTSKNIIRVEKNDIPIDTLFYQTSLHQNDLLTLVEGYTNINASQKGLSNGLYIFLPDSQHYNKSFNSSQVGSKNRISARVLDSPNNISLSQKGRENTITINPCDNSGSKK